MRLSYYGIKHLYPRLSFLGTKARAILSNSRPFTLLLPLVGGYFVIQTSLHGWNIPTPDPLRTWMGLLALIFVNAFGNNVNAFYDVEIDRVNKPYRPIPAGLLSRKEVGRVSLMFMWGAVVLSLLINKSFAVLMGLSILTTFFYSAWPLRLKRFLWVNNITQAFIRGILGVFAAWSIYAPITVQTLALGMIMFSLILPAQTSKDFPDMSGDLEFRVRTLPVVYGVAKTVRYMKALLVVPFVLVYLFVGLGVLPGAAQLFIILVPGVLLFMRWLNKPSQIMENSRGWLLFYGLMLATLGIFSIIL